MLTEGDTLFVAVDTVSADTACNLFAFINGPDDNTILVENDNFDCTFPPLICSCPSGHFISPHTGSYTVWVRSFGHNCTGRPAQYMLYLSKG